MAAIEFWEELTDELRRSLVYLSQSENLEVAQIYWQDQEAGLTTDEFSNNG